MINRACLFRIVSCSSRLVLALLLIGVPLRAADESKPQPPPADTNTSPYHVALLAYKAGHFQEALDALNQSASPADGRDMKVLVLKSRILAELHQYDEGEKILKSLLTANGPFEVQLALGDLLLHKRDFDGASKSYTLCLQTQPANADLTLKLIYARVGASDLVTAGKLASQLKPFDATADPLDPKHPGNPAYYFAKAAIAQATGKSSDADEDIETARTLYGITTTNRYLKTYLQVFDSSNKDITPASRAEPPSTNQPPASPHP